MVRIIQPATVLMHSRRRNKICRERGLLPGEKEKLTSEEGQGEGKDIFVMRRSSYISPGETKGWCRRLVYWLGGGEGA